MDLPTNQNNNSNYDDINLVEDTLNKIGEFALNWATEKIIDSVKWESVYKVSQLKKGDHIRIGRIGYYHHGIFVSPNEVIHFTGADNDAAFNLEEKQIMSTDFSKFEKCEALKMENAVIEVRRYTKDETKQLNSSDEIIELARKEIGKKDYDLIFNNCEHFAYFCTLGIKRSVQSGFGDTLK